MITREGAEEYTQSLGQIFAGGWRQVLWARDQGIPEALGLTLREWVEGRLGGYVRLAIPERREAVAVLTERGLSQREIADVVGVSQKTIDRDQEPESDGSPEPPERSEPEPPAEPNVSPEPPPTPKPHRQTRAEKRRQEEHAESVARRRDIDDARRSAAAIVTEFQAHVVAITIGAQRGERGLVTEEMLAEVRRALGQLEGCCERN